MISRWMRRLFAWVTPALLAAAPAATRPTTMPVPRNAVRPTPPPFRLGVNLCARAVSLGITAGNYRLAQEAARRRYAGLGGEG